jgi:hypothetical protein
VRVAEQPVVKVPVPEVRVKLEAASTPAIEVLSKERQDAVPEHARRVAWFAGYETR